MIYQAILDYSPKPITMKRLIVFLAIFSAFGLNSLAQTNEWEGNTSTNWHTAGNWSLNRVPLPGDNVEIPAGPSYQPVISTADANCNDMTIHVSATLSMSSPHTLNVGRNWTNNAGVNGFNPGTGTVRFIGSTNHIINSAGPEETFYHFTMDKASGSLMPATNLTILGDFTLLNGTFSYWITGLSHTFHGDVLFNGLGGFYPAASTTFKGSQSSIIQNNGFSISFSDITLDKDGPDLKLTIYPNLVVAPTTIHKGTLEVLGNYKSSIININNGGKMYISPGSEFSITDEMAVNSGGTLIIDGAEDNKTTIYKDGMGYHLFQVKNGGAISAQHAYFRKMDVNGITIHSGAVIDPDLAFRYCLFRDSEPGGVLLAINNNQDITIYGAEFPENTWSGGHNVRKTNNAGSVSFTGVSGAFSGPDYEDDLYDRIHWSDVPVNYSVFSQTIPNNQSECFNALETITAQYLYILSGGNVEMIAGQKIILLPDTYVFEGGTFHAYITTTGEYCENMRNLLMADNDEYFFAEPKTETIENSNVLNVFPNPTSDVFTLALDGDHQEIRVEVFDFLGKPVLIKEYLQGCSPQFSLSDNPAGIYLIRLISGDQIFISKIIKN